MSAQARPLAAGWTAKWSARLDDKDKNAFDAIRLALAALVLMEHSFFLIENSTAHEPLSRLTGGQINTGAFAVCMFFAISGFLVTRSFLLSRSLLRFLAKRVARIVPGFMAASLPGTLMVAALSWHLVEYPCLRLVRGRKA